MKSDIFDDAKISGWTIIMTAIKQKCVKKLHTPVISNQPHLILVVNESYKQSIAKGEHFL